MAQAHALAQGHGQTQAQVQPLPPSQPPPPPQILNHARSDSQTATIEGSPASGGLTQTYRRNGKPFSCEPCRRGKLKCGHELPTCSRCLRRGKARDCIYHPAPMTKTRDSPVGIQKESRTTTPTAMRSNTAPQLKNLTFIPPPLPAQHTQPSQPSPAQDAFPLNGHGRFRSAGSVPLAANNSSSSVSPSITSRPTPHSGQTRGIEIMKDKTGFLGSSAFSAIFTENKRSLGIVDDEPDRSSSPSPVSAEKVHQGAEVLSLLRDMNVFTIFLQRWFEFADSITMIRPMYACWIEGIKENFGDMLSNYKNVTDLYSLSELVWRNTQQSVPMDGNTTPLQWGRLHTGQNLRWETVGALYSVCVIVAIDLSEWDPAFNKAKTIAKDRYDLTEKLRTAMETCLSFSRECESITDLYVCVLFESVLILESIRGDTHFQAWVRIGEVINTCIHLGLHQEKHQDENTPFLVNEIRIRLFDILYGHDKSLSTFLGRPPRLSHRYCVLQLPLDLSDEEMMLEGPDLQRALDSLDNGWNTHGRFYRSTWRRVWAAHAQLREDILEIALGTNNQNLLERGEQIRENIRRIDETLPDFIKVSVLDVLAHCQNSHHPVIAKWERGRVQGNVLHLVSIKSGMLHTSLLLEKALINRLKSGTTVALIQHARLLLSYMLAVSAKRDFLSVFQLDLTFMIAFHGIPAAGILAVELLKQEKTQQYTPDVLPRSETIQDLSVFISALAAVEPNAVGGGNYAICNKAKKVLKQVMDKILSPRPATSGPEPDPAIYDDSNMYFPQHGSDADFLNWLENIEWERGSLFNT
ncbi:hypothetical protein K461DRAFT_264616 [Myriangium duriaei CBS 260.36]|uniref:Zn(2)-C6 fungal-type domain-containing protein n=1 Tax=Myriangium duriaei CBS 260.36 TaxID=1168546 RepID=A0A9P4J9F0_9PEZI|nr:hypothetical protein K461DRAFT_264616 [Myriangium duriaei CBS 260.36]